MGVFMFFRPEAACQNKVFKLLKRQSFENSGARLKCESFVHGKGHQLISSLFKKKFKLAAFLKFKHTVHGVITDEILEKWTNYTQCT